MQTQVVNYETTAQEVGTMVITKEKSQKQLIEEYMIHIQAEVYKGEKMLDFVRKNIGYIVQLSNGDLIEIEKPRIETHFCFGYDDYGARDYENAKEMQRYAKTNTDYFMEENLEKLNEMVELLETENVYVDYHYYNAPKDSKLKSIRVFKDWWQEQKYHDKLELITEQDKALIM